MSQTIKRGRIIKTTGSWHTIVAENGQYYDCKVRGKFRVKSGLKVTNPVAVGDWVKFQPEAEEGKGVIEELEDRSNYLIRQSPKKPTKVHVVAANIDNLVIVVTIAYPRIKQGFIDRLLVTAQAYDVHPVIVINKNDTYSDKEVKKRDEISHLYNSLGYELHQVSAFTGEGINQLKIQLQGSTNLLTGHSGVGKSALLNTMFSGMRLPTKSVSHVTGKGKHTTTFSQMLSLNENTYVIDTPGIKEFGLVGFDYYEISHFFPDMLAYLDDCKFNNCLHIQEPGCAVKKAVEDGQIDQHRYETYCRIIESLEENRYNLN